MNPAENYILNQPEPYRSMLLHLQGLIIHHFTNVNLKYKYKIPFYYINKKPLCFTAVSLKKGYLDVGFWKGNQIKVHKEYHITENRKMMISLRYFKLEDINDAVLIDVINEALTLY